MAVVGAAAIELRDTGDDDEAIALNRHARSAVRPVAETGRHLSAVAEIRIEAAVGIVAGQGEAGAAAPSLCRPARCSRWTGSPCPATSLLPPKSVVTLPPVPKDVYKVPLEL